MINPLTKPQLNLVNPEAKAPAFYQVVITRDERTSIEFLREVLSEVFFINPEQANDELRTFTESNRLICGMYTYDVAESKLSQMLDFISCARQRLQCSLEIME